MATLPEALVAAGVHLAPLQQAGTDLVLTWDTALTGPISGTDVLVMLPDMHLANFADGDIFRGIDPAAATRLTSLLDGLLAVSPAFRSMKSWCHYGAKRRASASAFERARDALQNLKQIGPGGPIPKEKLWQRNH